MEEQETKIQRGILKEKDLFCLIKDRKLGKAVITDD